MASGIQDKRFLIYCLIGGMSKRNVLILADSFPPGFAPRMGYLSKYLSRYDWEGEAIFIAQSDIYNFERLVGYIPSYQAGKYEEDATGSLFQSVKKNLQRFFSKDWVWSSFDTQIYQTAIPVLKEKKVDLILCSTSSFFPLEVAYKLSEKFHLPLLLDFRDIYEQSENSFQGALKTRIKTSLYKWKRNRIIGRANAVISVSPWHQEFLSHYNQNSHLIYNGFDAEYFYPRDLVKTEKFTIIYTGTVMPFNDISTRNPSWLFQAIAELFKNGKITAETFCVKFYTDPKSFPLLEKLSLEYEVSAFIKLEKWVKALQIPDILSSANVLLVLAASSGTKGILTTKLFEYLAIGRTILCVPSDRAVIRDLLNDTSAGFAAATFEDTYDFLLDKYEEWKRSGTVECHADFERIKQFSREKQAGQFVEIFNQIVG